MPRKNGFETTSRIYSACSTLPRMVLMTCLGSGEGLTMIGWDTRYNHLMYLYECFQGSSSGTWAALCCWATTCRANSKKAAATSVGARGIIVVGGRGTVWTYLYCLRTRSSKWCTIFCLLPMIHTEYQHTSWRHVTSRRCSYGLQVTWQCSIESNKPLKWSTCLNPLWSFHLPTYGFSRL